MVFIKTKTLSLIARCGGVLAASLSVFMVYKSLNIYKDSQFVKDAMAILESHEGAAQYLGKPIVASQVKLHYSEMEEESSPVASFTVKVKGPKQSGLMFFWAEKNVDNSTIKIVVKRIELEIGGDKSKRLLVKS